LLLVIRKELAVIVFETESFVPKKHDDDDDDDDNNDDDANCLKSIYLEKIA
jgi:hypothetical protein